MAKTLNKKSRKAGIGRSTAAAIASLCFSERVAILDANVKRVVTRVQGFDADVAVAANAPTGVQQAPATTPAPLSVAAAAPKLDLPSSDADYLHNPKPKYPGLSISRNEQGTVRLSVLVGADGKAKEVKIKVSSGFERLDRAAREAVLGWTFVPGKRAGVPEEMWYDLPMPFKLME